MSMSRKNYIAAAAVIRDSLTECAVGNTSTARNLCRNAVARVAVGLANMLAADNYRFSRSRFYDASDLNSQGRAGDDTYRGSQFLDIDGNVHDKR